MPVYQYFCSSCEKGFEELVLSASQRDQVKCPHCGGSGVVRQISAFAAHNGDQQACSGPAAQGCDGCCGGAGACPLTD